MEPVKIKSGPTEVIASGTVIGFAGNPIEITFGPSDERLKLLFAFQDEEGEAESRLETEVLDSTTLKLTLFNIKSPLGGICRITNPWGKSAVRVVSKGNEILRIDGTEPIASFDTDIGEIYELHQLT